MNIYDALKMVKPLEGSLIHPESSINLSAAAVAKGVCACRGKCGGHMGPCTKKTIADKGKFCAMCSKMQAAAELDAELDIYIEAGGPGSGRHKMGISDAHKQSVMALRHSGFKTDKAASALSGKHSMSMTDSTGKTHTVHLTDTGFTHTVASPSGKKIKTVGTGSHKSFGTYAKNNFASYSGPMS